MRTFWIIVGIGLVVFALVQYGVSCSEDDPFCRSSTDSWIETALIVLGTAIVVVSYKKLQDENLARQTAKKKFLVEEAGKHGLTIVPKDPGPPPFDSELAEAFASIRTTSLETLADELGYKLVPKDPATPRGRDSSPRPE
jgi:hypothetical protein